LGAQVAVVSILCVSRAAERLVGTKVRIRQVASRVNDIFRIWIQLMFFAMMVRKVAQEAQENTSESATESAEDSLIPKGPAE
jgi:hypothetical protein